MPGVGIFAAVLALASGGVGCSVPGALIVLDATAEADAQIEGYCVAVGADGARRFGRRYGRADFPLPQTLGVQANGRAHAEVRLTGIHGGLGGPVASSQITFGSGSDASNTVTLASCSPHPIGLTARATLPIAADRIAIVRTGAEAGGTAELIALSAGTGARYRFDSVSNGVAVAAIVEGGAGTPVQSLLSFDVDALNGDCADDLVVAAAAQGPIVWPSNTEGDPEPDLSRVTSPTSALALGAADLDGDGFADLVGVGAEGGFVLRSDRNGGFTAQPNAFDVAPTDGQALAIGDLDHDGQVDLVVGFALAVRWYRGLGGGRFKMQSVPVGRFNTAGLVAIDYDLDGDLDVIAATHDGSLRVFANDGRGGFTEDMNAVPSGLDPDLVGVIAADLDGDCVDDLVVLGMTQPPHLLSRTLGVFKDEGGFGAVPAHHAVAGDIDGDGRNDLALASAASVAVYTTGGR